MLQKKRIKLYKCLFFSNLIKVTFKSILQNPIITSCRKSFVTKLGNSGRLFKQAAFIGLALNCVNFNKFYKLKIKSTMFVLWNTIAAYTFIF